MKKNIFIRIIGLALMLCLCLSIAGCKSKTPENPTNVEKSTAGGETKTDDNNNAEPAKPVVIKYFTNLPDRKSGSGEIEQILIDEYVKENPHVTVEVEALQDEPYKQKFKAYVTGNNLPDIYMIWGQPAFFNPVMEQGYAEELNPADYESYGFISGTLDGFSLNGKLYGLCNSSDLMVLYYNKKMFADNNIKVPETFDELKEAITGFRQKKIAPIAMCGKDKWAMNILYHDIVVKEAGPSTVFMDSINNKSFNDPVLLKAAQNFRDLIDIGMFQDSFLSADYGAAQNLFAQSKAAMFYMGSWEASMDTDEEFPEEFRENLDVTLFPVIEGGKGAFTDVLAWSGGGYAVSSKSNVKDEAIKLLNYMMRPEGWTKLNWQKGVALPSQKFDQFLTGEETEIQKKIVDFLSNATSASGTPYNDLGDAEFKTNSENLIQELAAKIKSPEEFMKAMDDAAKLLD